MSYSTIFQCVNDTALRGRVAAACAQEGAQYPEMVAADMIWGIASKTDIEQAYAYALETGNPNPGGDEMVITDQMILSAVQSIGVPA